MTSNQSEVNLWNFVSLSLAILAIIATFFVWELWVGVLAALALIAVVVAVSIAESANYTLGETTYAIIAAIVEIVVAGLSSFAFYRALSFEVFGMRSGVLAAIATIALICISWRKTSHE